MAYRSDQANFDDSHLHQELKQTATFFDPSKFKESLKFPLNISHRPPLNKLDQSVKQVSESKKSTGTLKQELLFQQTIGKKNNSALKNVAKAQVKSTQSLQRNVIQTAKLTQLIQLAKSSPIKRVPVLKPYSPPQPKQVLDSVHYNQSVMSLGYQYQDTGHQREPDQHQRQLINYQHKQYESMQHDQRMQYLQKKLQQSKQEQAQEISITDLQPYQLKKTEPNRLEMLSKISLTKSSEPRPVVLPKISSQNTKFREQSSNIYPPSQQDTQVKTASSKQTSNNEFINSTIQIQEDSAMRKSKTAQETLRESQSQQLLQKQMTKLSQINYNPNMDPHDSLPQIHSPSSGAQTGFEFGQNKKKSFLTRRPQAKIVSRLFSSKSEN